MRVEVDRASLNDLNKTMKAIQDRSNRNSKSIVKQASLTFLVSIRSRTPKSGKAVKKPDWGLVKDQAELAKGNNYFVNRFKKDSRKITLYAKTKAQLNALRKIKYAGAAKSVWTGIMRKMGKSANVSGVLSGVSKNASKFSDGGMNQHSYYNELTSTLDYMNDIVSTSKIKNALRAANNKLKSVFKKKYGSRI